MRVGGSVWVWMRCAHLKGGLEHVYEQVIGKNVQLLLLFSLNISVPYCSPTGEK